ncbi:unnamed protein product [Calypogeia fissa]
MATVVAAGAQGVLSRAVLLGSTDSSGVGASKNVVSGALNSATGLRPLVLRSVRRRAPRSVQRRRNVGYQGPSALFDRGTEGSGSEGKKPEKKFITKEEEPKQYWLTPDEREGKNPMTTPLPYILILSVLSPFLILAVAFANNWIKIPVR